MHTFKNIALVVFCIASTACTTVIHNNTLYGLDGGADVTNECIGQADGADCNDGDFCNGADVCISGVCVRTGTPAEDGELCSVGTTQICVEGSCEVSSCGDGVVSPENGEECDTADPSIGCTAACQHICEPHSDTCDTAESPCDDNLQCKADFRCGVAVGAPDPEGAACNGPNEVAATCQAFECCPAGGC